MLLFDCSTVFVVLFDRSVESPVLRPTVNVEGRYYVSLSPPSEQSEWQRYCFRSMCFCVCVCSGPVNQTSLKLRTSYLTCMFPGTVRT